MKVVKIMAFTVAAAAVVGAAVRAKRYVAWRDMVKKAFAEVDPDRGSRKETPCM